MKSLLYLSQNHPRDQLYHFFYNFYKNLFLLQNKDINLNNNNITNISNLDTLILHTDLLKIGDAFEISKENGIKNIKTTTINKFNLVDISNLDSSFLKYNDERTLILNNLN